MKPTLDSRQLHAFAALARRGSFTLAARDLFLTQSAVSHAIRALEDDVGCRLFDRLGRRVLLTSAGEQFLRHAEKILREMESARASIEHVVKLGRTRLRIGAGTTACQHILPRALAELRRSHPQCSVRVESGAPGELLDWLRGGYVDVAVLAGSVSTPEHVVVPLFEDEWQFVVPPDHPWARTGRHSREQVESEAIVVPGQGAGGQEVMDYFREERIVPRHVIQVDSVEAARELVQARIGVAVLPAWLVAREAGAGALALVPLGARRLRRRWSVAHLKGRELGPAGQAFAAACAAASARLGAAPGVAA